ncbi:MAG: hypothetical protein LUG86_00230 [Oscillospiraceae bacterium]|nr:hypothetical protein [Oscillospiraceae bacterium]
MADVYNEQNYQAMMQALYAFASNVYSVQSELQTLAGVCAGALVSGDQAVEEINKKITACTVKYAEIAERAGKLAEELQAEIDHHRKEDAIWAEDD